MFRKLIAISFLSLFLCANTEIVELLKLPNFILHFFEHHNHENEQNISFVNFVKSHYTETNKHSDTDKHDENNNLPFKTINTSVNIAFVFEYQKCFSFPKPVVFSFKNVIPFCKELYTSSVFNCIWLPPKLS